MCGWLLFPELDEDWRPDQSGILVLQGDSGEPAQGLSAAGHGVQLLVTGGEAAILRPGFAEYVFGLIRAGVGVYLTAMIAPRPCSTSIWSLLSRRATWKGRGARSCMSIAC